VDYPDADVLIMLTRAGFKIKEVPVRMYSRAGAGSMHSGLRRRGNKRRVSLRHLDNSACVRGLKILWVHIGLYKRAFKAILALKDNSINFSKRHELCKLIYNT